MSPRVTVAHEGAPPCPLPFATDSCPRNVVEALIEHDWSSEAFKRRLRATALATPRALVRRVVLQMKQRVAAANAADGGDITLD